jgi:glycosyltransferase involved in cell wall biosynthesis
MISVVVPVKNQWLHTETLLRCLRDEPCRVLVIDNGSTDNTGSYLRGMQRRPAWRGRLSWTRQPGSTIYSMWNHGFDWAYRQRIDGAWYVLMTNNDVVLPPGALDALRRPLRDQPDAWVSYPDYDAEWRVPPLIDAGAPLWRETRGVLSDGGMFGACFMLAGHRIPWRPLVTDLTYEWWYGDNHLAEEIEQHGGKQYRVVGLPVQHVNEATASTLDPSILYGMKYRDRHRWITRYERNT